MLIDTDVSVQSLPLSFTDKNVSPFTCGDQKHIWCTTTKIAYVCICSINMVRSRCVQAAYGGSFCRVEVNWVHSLSLVDSVKLGEDERPLPLMRLYMFR